MSKYTTEVRFICESLSGLVESTGYSSVNEVVENARSKIFDFPYPIFEVGYKSVLEKKILKHFYTREIGAETVGLWKVWLDTRLNEIMPYYNQRYKSTLLEFNPLYDVDYSVQRNVDNSGNKNDTGNSSNSRTEILTTNNEGSVNRSGGNEGSESVNNSRNYSDSDDNWNYYSDTPQGGIDGLRDLNYLTNATHNVDSKSGTEGATSTGSNSNTFTEAVVTGDKRNENRSDNSSGTNALSSVYNSTEEFVEHVMGKRGGESYSKMLEDFRKTFVNIDMEIIHELDDLFMNLW